MCMIPAIWLPWCHKWFLCFIVPPSSMSSTNIIPVLLQHVYSSARKSVLCTYWSSSWNMLWMLLYLVRGGKNVFLSGLFCPRCCCPLPYSARDKKMCCCTQCTFSLLYVVWLKLCSWNLALVSILHHIHQSIKSLLREDCQPKVKVFRMRSWSKPY